MKKVIAARHKRSTGYYGYGDDFDGGYYDYERDYYGRNHGYGYGYRHGRRDDQYGRYGRYGGHGRSRSYSHRYGYEYAEYEPSFRTTVTQTIETGVPHELTNQDDNNNVQMSLSFICNTKLQSKDEGQGGYAQPGARKAEGGEGYDGSGEYMEEPLYHPLKGGYSSSDSSSSSEGSKSSRLYIRRPRYDEYAHGPSQHIGPNMDINCEGTEPNFH